MLLVIVPAGITADAAVSVDPRDLPPVIREAFYDTRTRELTTTFTTHDIHSRFFETFIMSPGEYENCMGTHMYNGTLYSIRGIMSFDSGDTKHVSVAQGSSEDEAVVTISQEQYFGEGAIPQPGETVYVFAQTEGAHEEGKWGEGSQFSDPFEYAIPDSPTPEKIKNLLVKMKRLQRDGMMSEFGYEVSGTVATLEVTIDRQPGISNYFLTPLTSDNIKMITGNMPFITMQGGVFCFENNDGFTGEGPNGEKLDWTPTTLTAEIQVVKLDEEPEYDAV